MEVVGSAKGSKAPLADGSQVCIHFGVTDGATKLFGHFVELF